MECYGSNGLLKNVFSLKHQIGCMRVFPKHAQFVLPGQ